MAKYHHLTQSVDGKGQPALAFGHFRPGGRVISDVVSTLILPLDGEETLYPIQIDMSDTAKFLMMIGLVLFVIGFGLYFFSHRNFMNPIPIPGLGKLPGDIVIKKENFSLYFPLATCLLVSAIISLILFLINRR